MGESVSHSSAVISIYTPSNVCVCVHAYINVVIGLVLCWQVSRSAQDHEDITNALLYSILTDPATAPKVRTPI